MLLMSRSNLPSHVWFSFSSTHFFNVIICNAVLFSLQFRRLMYQVCVEIPFWFVEKKHKKLSNSPLPCYPWSGDERILIQVWGSGILWRNYLLFKGLSQIVIGLQWMDALVEPFVVSVKDIGLIHISKILQISTSFKRIGYYDSFSWREVHVHKM